MMTDEYSVCGNVAVGHKLLKDGDDLEKVAADIAIFALGWESRFLALESHVALGAKKILVLDFELASTDDDAIEANRKKLIDLARKWDVAITKLKLAPSTEFLKNINTLGHTLTELARQIGSYHGSFRRVFVECSTMPRVYIQWLVAFGFGWSAPRFAGQVG